MSVEIAVFDMDGCLYCHKDPEHLDQAGFYETMLGKAVAKAAVDLIIGQERVDEEEAARILGVASQDEVGPSRSLGERYGMSRIEYFEATWGVIDLDGFIDEADIYMAKRVITKVKERDISTRLLTAAPKPWAAKVLDRLGVAGEFDVRMHGEDFDTKDKVFADLAARRDASSVVSIGDNYKTDIEPAQRLGMMTYHVTRKTPLIGVLEVL